MSLLDGWWDDFFFGLMTVLQVFFVSLVIAVVCGLIGASAKLSKSRVLRGIAQAYTVVFRGAPELLVLLLFYFGMAIALTAGVAALLGNLVLGQFGPEVIAATTAVAAGAILSMITDTMVPEAFEEAGHLAGLISVHGFLAAFALSKMA